MKRGAQVVAVIMLSVAVGACASVSPTPERQAVLDAVRDYERIVEKANLLYATDFLGCLPGEMVSIRVPVNCNQTDTCSIGFVALLQTTTFSADAKEIEVRQELNGVRAVVERGSTTYSEFYNLGGWMEHSFFYSSAKLFNNETDPDFGVTRVSAYANVYSTDVNPAVSEGRATWQGFVSARDASVTDSIENYVTGDATINVALDGETPLADVLLSNLRNGFTGTEYSDIDYAGMRIVDGRFECVSGANDHPRGSLRETREPEFEAERGEHRVGPVAGGGISLNSRRGRAMG